MAASLPASLRYAGRGPLVWAGLYALFGALTAYLMTAFGLLSDASPEWALPAILLGWPLIVGLAAFVTSTLLLLISAQWAIHLF